MPLYPQTNEDLNHGQAFESGIVSHLAMAKDWGCHLATRREDQLTKIVRLAQAERLKEERRKCRRK